MWSLLSHSYWISHCLIGFLVINSYVKRFQAFFLEFIFKCQRTSRERINALKNPCFCFVCGQKNHIPFIWNLGMRHHKNIHPEMDFVIECTAVGPARSGATHYNWFDQFDHTIKSSCYQFRTSRASLVRIRDMGCPKFSTIIALPLSFN